MLKYVIVFKGGTKKNKEIECDYLVSTDGAFMFRKNDGIIFSVRPQLVDTIELQGK